MFVNECQVDIYITKLLTCWPGRVLVPYVHAWIYHLFVFHCLAHCTAYKHISLNGITHNTSRFSLCFVYHTKYLQYTAKKNRPVHLRNCLRIHADVWYVPVHGKCLHPLCCVFYFITN